MSRFLYRLGHGSAAHPWRTISAWLVVAAAIIGLAAALGGTPHDDYNVPGARAQVGIEQLRKTYGQFGYIDFVPEPNFDIVPNTDQIDLTLTADEGKTFSYSSPCRR